MSEPVPAGTSQWTWPAEVIDAIQAIDDKPSRAKFERLGRVLHELWPDVLVFAREPTSVSGSDSLPYKEEEPKEVVWHHHANIHFPEPHGTPACLALERGDVITVLRDGSEYDL